MSGPETRAEVEDFLFREGVGETVQMIDSTVIRAHHCAAGAKGGLQNRVWGAREEASRQKFTSAPMGRACP